MPKNPLQHLADFGQSVWVDNLSRAMIHSGELQRLIDEDGVVGITSNPTIFDAAISKTADYDEQIRELVADGRSTEEIYEAVVVRDIQMGADILRPVYERTGGHDGFVSLEVSPYLAHDTEGTISEARRLWRRVNRPNVMIKVPGTSEGIPAIEQLLYEGVNVNITLLFSLDAYRAVMRAYLQAMRRRLNESKPVDQLASVASFFVSRVDSEADKRLEELAQAGDLEHVALAKALLGTLAIANARLAYQAFKEVFTSDAFGQLAGRGVPLQRPLWASTSTKNPAFSDTLYVDELIGPNTVETLAPASIEAFRDHGTVTPTIEQDVEAARDVLAGFEELGVAYDDIIDVLVREGVEKFADSFRALMHGLEEKRARFAAELEAERAAQLGMLTGPTERAIERLASEQAARRLMRGDAGLWSAERDVRARVAERLGWLPVVHDMLQHADAGLFYSLADDVQTRGYQHVVLFGMGGSSLAPEVMASILDRQPGFPRLSVLDTTNPEVIAQVAMRADDERTLFIVSSKSGTTIETKTLFHYFLEQRQGSGDDFIVITDPGSALEYEARRIGCWRIFTNRHDIGGRYSALSFFGLVPATVAGIDVEQLLWDAAVLLPIHDERHPGFWLGAALAAGYQTGRDKLTLLAHNQWAAFGDWLEQLIAESTGKHGKGIVPVAREHTLPADRYGSDRIFVHLGVPSGELAGLMGELALREHPALAWPVKLGRELLLWEIATAVAGVLLEINPFDEPNVQEAKDATNAVLRDPAADVIASVAPDAAADFVVSQAQAGDYIAIMAYVNRTPATEYALEQLRAALGRRSGLATTLGFGPRFLHSTGQLHKGGAPNGVFLQVVEQPAIDLGIPQESFSFRQLFAAQSAGDFLTLKQHGLRAVRIELPVGDHTAILAMIEAVSGAVVPAAD